MVYIGIARHMFLREYPCYNGMNTGIYEVLLEIYEKCARDSVIYF